MSRQYIENKYAWIRQQKRIGTLLEIPYENLSVEEKLELAYDKYFKREKISYDEYLLMVKVANDEIWFCVNNVVYQVIHESPENTAMLITEYNGNQKTLERSENYSSVIELLDKFRIDGKTIEEIWNEVVFNEV